MPVFIVTAINPAGNISTQHLQAGSRQQLEAMCAQQGLALLSVKSPLSFRIAVRPARKFDLIPFAQELLALQNAGLSISESLKGLHDKANDSQKPILSGLLEHIKQGQSFSAALGKYPEDFPALLRALVQAAEKTSNLPQAIERYLEYAHQADAVRRKITNAALYPSLLLLVGGGVLLLLMMYVIPRFAGVYEGLQGELPWLSEILLWWGRTMRDHAGAVMLVLAGGAWLAYRGIKNKHNQGRAFRLLLRNPRIAALWKGYRLGRLYRALGLLLTGGIPVQIALQQLEQLLGQHEVNQLAMVRQRISEGAPLSLALAQSDMTTEISLQMLAVGERTGSVGEMLTQTANFLETDTSKAVEAFSRIFEPLLMALIGLIIGVVVVLMYMPIFELASSLQ